MHRVLVTFALTFVLASLSMLGALGVAEHGGCGLWKNTSPYDAAPIAAFVLVEENSVDEDGDDACAGGQVHVWARAPVVFLKRADTNSIESGHRLPLAIRARGPPLARA